MYDRYKLEAFYWAAFAHLALSGKLSIEDFRAKLDRCASGDFVSEEDIAEILHEFYGELGLLNSARPRSSFAQRRARMQRALVESGRFLRRTFAARVPAGLLLKARASRVRLSIWLERSSQALALWSKRLRPDSA